jgi:uncharacterized protein YchJ
MINRLEDTHPELARFFMALSQGKRPHGVEKVLRGVFYRSYGRISASVQRQGRNDPCSCGSGKKYKKCCGKGR